MSRMLRIDASSRSDGSHSRELGDVFEQSWLQRNPGYQVLRRDAATAGLPHISAATITGFYTPADQRDAGTRQALALSDELIAELKSVETLLITTPIYNFSIPSALKAYIDQIVRINETFSYDGQNFTGLVPVKRAFVVVSYGAGGYHDGGPLAQFDFVEPYLRLLLNFLGIPEVHFFWVEGTSADPEVVKAARRRADEQIRTAVAAM